MSDLNLDRLRQQLGEVADPEIPVVSIADLGVLRAVEVHGDQLTITITPTYSGCPAMEHIADRVKMIGESHGFATTVNTVFEPAWTSDWMTETARQALEQYGIAPPRTIGEVAVELAPLRCPRCHSPNLAKITDFGSTACKALYRCESCLEPFDHFKEI